MRRRWQPSGWSGCNSGRSGSRATNWFQSGSVSHDGSAGTGLPSDHRASQLHDHRDLCPFCCRGPQPRLSARPLTRLRLVVDHWGSSGRGLVMRRSVAGLLVRPVASACVARAALCHPAARRGRRKWNTRGPASGGIALASVPDTPGGVRAPRPGAADMGHGFAVRITRSRCLRYPAPEMSVQVNWPRPARCSGRSAMPARARFFQWLRGWKRRAFVDELQGAVACPWCRVVDETWERLSGVSASADGGQRLPCL